MEKIFDRIDEIPDLIKKRFKDRLFIIINLLGAAVALIPVFNGIIYYKIGIFFSLMLNVLSIFFIPLRLGILGVLAVNIIAYLTVEHDKNIAGLILSLFGSAGAFVGVLSNRGYRFKKAVIAIFNIRIWIIAWTVSYIFFVASHF
ncbi:MAG: hypothetical protein J1E40_10510 [Oscillospiraceae bacterium]|nr:hypothetical protein [Oscillospiraceae bacterium]